MLALVDGEVFFDACGVGGVVVVPAGFEFFEFDGVGAVSIHFIGAHVDEYGVWGVEAGGLKEVEGAYGVDVKIIKGTRGR